MGNTMSLQKANFREALKTFASIQAMTLLR